MLWPILIANLLAIGTIGGLWLTEAYASDIYVQLAQEDGVVEWATVLALAPALVLAIRGFRRARAHGGAAWWFYGGLALFCVFFAGEEISWAQRLFAYRPPEYFLEHNTQQELNVHNLFKHVVRTKYLLMALMVGWGLVLPAIAAVGRPIRALLDRLGLVAPPLWLAPAFAANLALIYIYPWDYTGEIAECVFALLIFSTLALRAADRPARWLLTGGMVIAATAAVTPGVLLRLAAPDDPAGIELARAEAVRLRRDWARQTQLDDDIPSGCRTHIRIYTWARKHNYERFLDGTFTQAAPADREADREAGARFRFFLDPWNNPYWIRHVCRRGREKVYIYSFGPNRRRDSSRRKLRGDDVGIVFDPFDDSAEDP